MVMLGLVLVQWFLSKMTGIRSKFICLPRGKSGTGLFNHCNVGLLGGTLAKLGPLARRDSCAEARGVLVRLMTHFCLVVLEGVELLVVDPGAVVVHCV